MGSSTTDLDPIFGLGLKYFRYLTNNWLVGVIFEHRIFDPQSTRPLSADLDIDSFGTNHFILDARYQWDPIDNNRRLRPFVGVQLEYVPEIGADGTWYAEIPPSGSPRRPRRSASRATPSSPSASSPARRTSSVRT